MSANIRCSIVVLLSALLFAVTSATAASSSGDGGGSSTAAGGLPSNAAAPLAAASDCLARGGSSAEDSAESGQGYPSVSLLQKSASAVAAHQRALSAGGRQQPLRGGASSTLRLGERQILAPQYISFNWLNATIGMTPGVTVHDLVPDAPEPGLSMANITTDDALQSCVLSDVLVGRVGEGDWGTLCINVVASPSCDVMRYDLTTALNSTFAGNPFVSEATQIQLPNSGGSRLMLIMKPMVVQIYSKDSSNPWSIFTETAEEAFSTFLRDDGVGIATMPGPLYKR